MVLLRFVVTFMGFVGISWAGGIHSLSASEEQQAPEKSRRPIWGTGQFDYLLEDHSEVSSPISRDENLLGYKYGELWVGFDDTTEAEDNRGSSIIDHDTMALPVSAIENTLSQAQQMPPHLHRTRVGLEAGIWRQSYPSVSREDPLLFAVSAGYVARQGLVWAVNQQAFQEWHQVRPADQLLQNMMQVLGQPRLLKRKTYRTLRTRIRGHLKSNRWDRYLLLKGQDAEKLRCLWLLLGRKRGEALTARLESWDLP